MPPGRTRVVTEDVEKLGVQCTGKVRPIRVPGQNVERRRALAEEVVVDHVVDEEVVGTHQGECAAHLTAGDDARLQRAPAGERQKPAVAVGRYRCALTKVEQGDP